MKKGKLIIIDSGTDGSGKATQTEKLFEKLKNQGENVRKITFPNYDSPACMPVKMYLNGEFGTDPSDVNAYVASTFYAIDRFSSYKKDWGEFYNNGGIILSDRYVTSNMVHQGAKIDNDSDREDYLNWLYDLEYQKYKLPVPDCIIYLDLPPESSEKLMMNRLNKFTGEETKDIHERNHQYLVSCYKNAGKIADKYNWYRIKCINNGEIRTIDDIAEEIYQKVNSLLSL